MLTKYKDVRRLDLEKGVNKSFENVSCQRRRSFYGGCAKFLHFLSVFFFFSAELI